MADEAPGWPTITQECRPWAYWWWLGSAVDTTNLTRELERSHDAGMGGLHIVPLYGVNGWEDRSIPYLTPRWMAMMGYAVSEAHRLGMGMDMTTGSGWNFGGPNVSDSDANAAVIVNTFQLAEGKKLEEKFDRAAIQTLMAFGRDGKKVDLTSLIGADGSVDWLGQGGPWEVYAISQHPSGLMVKRPNPGDNGHMLNLIYGSAMSRYLERFSAAFDSYDGPRPRSMYHDSYEYKSNWSPDFFAQFEKRRGYRLQDELPALFGKVTDADHAARVKHDYRETISDIMVEESLATWVKWAHKEGFLTRNQAHGSPGNLLDLYAASDIPDTEIFNRARNLLFCKFASSAAHVTGKPLVAAETGTWVKEHFNETLADVKYVADDMFLAGVNHVFYVGNTYSPDEAPWPGWLFYASAQMHPRNSIWHDARTLNDYVARCQSVLQSGHPDNDILVYWPVHDYWQESADLMQPLEVFAHRWLETQPMGNTASNLWQRGFAFDYISDRQIQAVTSEQGRVNTPGESYRVVVVPPCQNMPLGTCLSLLRLAREGASVIFEKQLPQDVPGAGQLDKRRAALGKILAEVQWGSATDNVREASFGAGKILVGDLDGSLARAGVKRESLVDHLGLFYVRRKVQDGQYYFIANRGGQGMNGWISLASIAKSISTMDPMNGQIAPALCRVDTNGSLQVRLALMPGESIILRAAKEKESGSDDARGPWMASGQAVELQGTWQVKFLEGGPEMPKDAEIDHLASWTDFGGEVAQRFGGTARYSLHFEAPSGEASNYWLSLGEVSQSARVRLNGRDLGTLILPPFRIPVAQLQPHDNQLEVEVTSVSANRIRDMDRRGIKWKIFKDINFVDMNYHPFDASKWPITSCGLLGPVTLTPIQPAQ